jgi:translocation and assembly module TamA
MNFSTITPGEPYSDTALNRYVRRLNASGYFASVQARIDAEAPNPDAAKVDISVIEARPKRFEGGVGYSTDVHFRTDANYRDVNFDGHGLQFVADARLESKIQSASVKFTRPPNASGWIAAYFAGAVRTDIENLITRTAAAGTRWHTIEERDEHALSATYYHDEQTPQGSPTQTANAVYPEYERHWRRVDDLVAPTTGWMASAFVGGGVPAFPRAISAACAAASRGGCLSRETTSSMSARKPARCLPAVATAFRPRCCSAPAGARRFAATISRAGRGPEWRRPAGSLLCVASVDATHWIDESWGLAVFLDAGNAVDSLSHAPPRARLWRRRPRPHAARPFRLDVAYGQDVRQVRVQFSVGLTF